MAPPAVPVHGLEIYEQIRDANRVAAGSRELTADVAARLRATKSGEPK
jgi:sRNA-binding carbon storage regulator CsrA